MIHQNSDLFSFTTSVLQARNAPGFTGDNKSYNLSHTEHQPLKGTVTRCCARRDRHTHRDLELLWRTAWLHLAHLNAWSVLHLNSQHLPIYLDVPAVEIT